jgi:aerobic-type carbon monoxide dehydrogenase small subunit (CoxS/CutS family)
MSLMIIVNGQPRELTERAGQSLLELLRDDLDLAG